MHRPLFYLTWQTHSLLQNLLTRPAYGHVRWMIQRTVDMQQRMLTPICTLYTYAQLYTIFAIRGDMSLINP